MQTDPISIKHDASLQQAIEIASNFVGESIPVIDRDSGKMHGIVTEADLFNLYLSLQSRIADLVSTRSWSGKCNRRSAFPEISHSDI